MRKILTFHTVSPEFLSVLFACGDQPRVSEEGSATLNVTRKVDQIYREIACDLPLGGKS